MRTLYELFVVPRDRIPSHNALNAAIANKTLKDSDEIRQLKAGKCDANAAYMHKMYGHMQRARYISSHMGIVTRRRTMYILRLFIWVTI